MGIGCAAHEIAAIPSDQKGLYRGRASVEREFGRLKNEWSLAPLRVRRIERVRLHADLTILSQLTVALNRSQEVTLEP
jgi:transposase